MRGPLISAEDGSAEAAMTAWRAASSRRCSARTGLLLVVAALCCSLLVWNSSLESVYDMASLMVADCGHARVPVISADSRGRLGNNLAEYATIYALGLRYNMTAVATPSLLRSMAAVFPHISLPVVGDACTMRHRRIVSEKFEQLPDDVRRANSWKIDYYPHRISVFWRYRDHLRREFTFRPDLANFASELLRKVGGDGHYQTFVGVHIRRTDYAKHLLKVFGGRPVEESFYQSAMALCRKRYPKVVFIITSDDLQWCREHLSAPDVFVLGDPRLVSPGVERDLALLAACNHTIFDYGTFGFFAAFLAGGDLILADGYSEKEHEVVSELRQGGIEATFLDGRGRRLQKCVHCR